MASRIDEPFRSDDNNLIASDDFPTTFIINKFLPFFRNIKIKPNLVKENAFKETYSGLSLKRRHPSSQYVNAVP